MHQTDDQIPKIKCETFFKERNKSFSISKNLEDYVETVEHQQHQQEKTSSTAVHRATQCTPGKTYDAHFTCTKNKYKSI